MIIAYVARDGAIERLTVPAGETLPANSLWVDLASPDEAERRQVEASLHLSLPTQEEMQEIEPSSRIYAEDGVFTMTATIIARADEADPTARPISFILSNQTLVTLRYSDPRPFHLYGQRIVRQPATCSSGSEALIGLLEAVVDRIADILEKVSVDLDAISRLIFVEPARSRRRLAPQLDLRSMLKRLARDEDLTSTARESLLGILRVVRFFATTGEGTSKKQTKEQKARLNVLAGDIGTLNEHVSFELQKITFLLEATLGVIDIEQNRITKQFSIAAVVFLPPTMVATIYGMNFKNMPELDWTLGYPLALVLMLASALISYWFFRWRGWM